MGFEACNLFYWVNRSIYNIPAIFVYIIKNFYFIVAFLSSTLKNNDLSLQAMLSPHYWLRAIINLRQIQDLKLLYQRRRTIAHCDSIQFLSLISLMQALNEIDNYNTTATKQQWEIVRVLDRDIVTHNAHANKQSSSWFVRYISICIFVYWKSSTWIRRSWSRDRERNLSQYDLAAHVSSSQLDKAYSQAAPNECARSDGWSVIYRRRSTCNPRARETVMQPMPPPLPHHRYELAISSFIFDSTCLARKCTSIKKLSMLLEKLLMQTRCAWMRAYLRKLHREARFVQSYRRERH